MALDDKQRERLAELRAAETDRQARAQEESEALELEALELRAALESVGLKEGSDFKIVVNALGGVYAVRKPDTRAIRNWENATQKQQLNLEWVISLLRHYILMPGEVAIPKAAHGQSAPEMAPGVRPEGSRGIEWSQMCAQRPGLCWQTLRAFLELMGVDIEGAEKK